MLFAKLFMLLLLLAPAPKDKTPLYKDPSKTPEERTEDLLSRMTLDEKIAQLECVWMTFTGLYDNGVLNMDKVAAKFPNGLGQIGRISEDKPNGFFNGCVGPRDAVNQYNQYQKYFIENTRLGIPAMCHEEGLHGHQAKDATVLPMPLGMSCSWDEDLYLKAYDIIGQEIRATGGHEVLAPVVDVTRDPRWGRSEETLGEDPYLNGRLGTAQVRGYQGSMDGKVIDQNHVGATLKHFGVHADSEGGHNKAASYVDEVTAMDVYLRPFQMCIENANPWNVMITYPELWGIPAHGNKKLIDGVLRGKFGFQGMTVSDYSGVSQLHSDYNVAETNEDAALMGITAGVDIETPEPTTYPNLKHLVESGRLDESVIDKSVRRILLEKFRLGLFENPYLDPDYAEKLVGNQAARDMAYRAASESIVLLQNNNNTLPFAKDQYKTIAVIGPNAAEALLGGYTDKPKQALSFLDAFKERYGNSINILYAEGCKLTQPGGFTDIDAGPDMGGVFHVPSTVLVPLEENLPRIAEAVEVAKKADAVILCLGSNENIAKENGDTPSLELLAGQNELAKAIAELGKPTVALVITGTPNNLSELQKNASSILQCYYLGQEGGYAMVDAIFGDVNPTGKLSMSIARGADHLPVYYSQNRGGSTTYTVGQDHTPLYPFGYGMSYTTYEYSNVRLSADKMPVDGKVDVLVDVKNTGNRDGEEIVQMYIKDDYSSVVRPAKELKGFKRVAIKAGETKTVSIPIDKTCLEFYNADINLVVEPGTFTVMVGPSSAEVAGSATLTVE